VTFDLDQNAGVQHGPSPPPAAAPYVRGGDAQHGVQPNVAAPGSPAAAAQHVPDGPSAAPRVAAAADPAGGVRAHGRAATDAGQGRLAVDAVAAHLARHRHRQAVCRTAAQALGRGGATAHVRGVRSHLRVVRPAGSLHRNAQR
jgi:hypothetical protein